MCLCVYRPSDIMQGSLMPTSYVVSAPGLPGPPTRPFPAAPSVASSVSSFEMSAANVHTYQWWGNAPEAGAEMAGGVAGGHEEYAAMVNRPSEDSLAAWEAYAESMGYTLVSDTHRHTHTHTSLLWYGVSVVFPGRLHLCSCDLLRVCVCVCVCVQSNQHAGTSPQPSFQQTPATQPPPPPHTHTISPAISSSSNVITTQYTNTALPSAAAAAKGMPGQAVALMSSLYISPAATSAAAAALAMRKQQAINKGKIRTSRTSQSSQSARMSIEECDEEGQVCVRNV